MIDSAQQAATPAPPIAPAIVPAGPRAPAGAASALEATGPASFLDALARVLTAATSPPVLAGAVAPPGRQNPTAPKSSAGPSSGVAAEKDGPATPAAVASLVPTIAPEDPLPAIASAPAAPRQPSADPIATPAKAPPRGDVDRSKAKESRVRPRAKQPADPGAAANVPATPPAQAIAPVALVLPPPPPSGSAPHGDPDHGAAPLDAVGARGEGRRSVEVPAATAEPTAKASASLVTAAPAPEQRPTEAPPVPASVAVAAGNAAPVTSTPPASHAEPTPASPTPALPTPAAAVPHAPDRSPAGQVAPVMVSLASSGAGTHRLVMRLDPPELGRLEISLVRTPDTGTRVEITAERPTTLALLHQDAPALHRALSEAGVPVDGRSLTMQLGQPGSQNPGGYGGGNGEPGTRRFAAWSSGGGALESLSDPSPFPAPRDIRSALDITA